MVARVKPLATNLHSEEAMMMDYIIEPNGRRYTVYLVNAAGDVVTVLDATTYRRALRWAREILRAYKQDVLAG